MFFSGRLYKEAFRQTRVIGAVLAFVSLIVTGIVPLITLILSKNETFTGGGIQIVSPSSMASGFKFMAVAIPVVMILKLFSFLFKRGASDFYHALPYTRECIFITHAACAFTWMIAISLGSISFAAICYAANKAYRIYSYYILNNFIIYFGIMLLITSALLIAVSVMGKAMISVELATFIAFLPRCIFLMALYIIDQKTMVVDMTNVTFFSPKYSLIMMAYTGFAVDYAGYNNCFTYLPGIISTFVLGVAYFLLALFLFRIRKSEFAENAAPNRKIQAVIRTVFSSVFFLGAVTAGFLGGSYNVDGIIFLTVVGVFVYFLYELFATRSVKKMFKAFPGLIFPAIVCIIFGVVCKSQINHVLNTELESSKIQSVQIQNMADYYYSYADTSYNDIVKNKIVFENDEIFNIIVNAYSYTREGVKDETLNPYNQSLVEREFKINCKGGGSICRKIYLKTADNEKLEKIFMKDDEYKEASIVIPSDPYVENFKDRGRNSEIWEQFVEEYNKLSDKDKKRVINDRSSFVEIFEGDEVETYAILYASGVYEGQIYNNFYSLYYDLMPKTCEMYSRFTYEEGVVAFNKLDDVIRNQDMKNGSADISINGDVYVNGFKFDYMFIDFSINGGEITNVFVSLDAYEQPGIATEADGEYYDDKYYNVSCAPTPEEGLKLYDLFAKAIDTSKPADPNKPEIEISCSSYEYAGINDNYINGNIIVNYDEAAMEEFVEYIVSIYTEN